MSTPLAAGLLLVLAAGVAIYLERRRRDRRGIEAIVEATREDIPDYVPDEWTEEYK